MDTVWISHPHLEGAVEVPATSLAQHQRAGWEQTDPPPPPPPPELDPGPDDTPSDQTSEAPAPAGASALPDESPRRRRASTKEGE